MAVNINKVGQTELKRSGENVMTDIFEVRFTGEDAPPHQTEEVREVNGRKIGCSHCNENTFAFFRDGGYTCSVCRKYTNKATDKDYTKGYYKDEL